MGFLFVNSIMKFNELCELLEYIDNSRIIPDYDVVEESFLDFFKNPKALIATALLLGIDYNYTLPKLQQIVSQKVQALPPEQVQQIKQSVPTKMNTPVVDRILKGLSKLPQIITSGVPLKNTDNSFLPQAFKYIKKNEGSHNKIYKDSKGNWTIGVGHLVTSDELKIYKDKVLSDTEVEDLFKSDVAKKMVRIKKQFGKSFNKYSDNLKTAILDGYFRGDLSGSPKTRAFLRLRQFKQAAEAYLDNDEYIAAKKAGSGVAARMESNARIMANEK